MREFLSYAVGAGAQACANPCVRLWGKSAGLREPYRASANRH
jgi:hypothetical protein